jgi:hypothetical protein
MSAQTILNEDWSDYDNKKKKGTDAKFFSCNEDWEVDYLKQKIKKAFPGLSESFILDAIASCCDRVPAPRPRKAFVECVMIKLGF